MKIKHLLVLAFFVLIAPIMVTSCQDEEIEPNPENENIINSETALLSLMQSTSAYDGSVDDIMDEANCLSVNLPVTVVVNGITITINTLEDLGLIEAIYNEFDNDDDVLEYIFPITIILNDYTEITIENQEQLQEFIDECTADEDVIECIDFQYPISFSMYDTNFQVIDTVVIGSDFELYVFLQSLETSNSAVVLASLNFPVTMVYANGDTVEVNSNQELEAAINAAEEECDYDDDNDCTLQEVSEALQDCHWEIVSYNGDDNFIDFDLVFGGGGALQISEGDLTEVVLGSWNLESTDQGIVLSIEQLTAFSQDLGGDWLVVDCADDRFELVRTVENTTTEIVMEINCDDNQVSCDFQDVRDYLVACPQIPALNGYTPSFTTFTFHDSNEISTLYENDLLYSGTWDIAMIEGELKVFINFNGLEDYNGEYAVVECNEDSLVLQQGEDVLVLTQQCTSDNPFECFSNTEYVICDNEEPFNDGIATFDLYEIFPNCSNDNIEMTFHETLMDAETGVNALTSPYSNVVSSSQTIYVSATLAGGNTFEIFEVNLVVEDCGQTCSEQDVDAFLLDCTWNVVNYNGSDNLIVWNLDFESSNNIVVIYTETATIDATWTTSQTNDGVIIEFSNVAGSDIQAITGQWLVVECEEDRLQLHRENDIMVIERTCD